MFVHPSVSVSTLTFELSDLELLYVYDHDHSFPGIKGQGHRSSSAQISKVKVEMVSVEPQSSMEDTFWLRYFCQRLFSLHYLCHGLAFCTIFDFIIAH